MGIFIAAVTVSLIVSFLCSVSEAALLSISHAQVQALGDGRVAQTLRKFKQEVDVPIAAILILNTTANTIGAAVAGASFVDVFGEADLWTFSGVFTLAILLFSEIIPKTAGAVHPTRIIGPVVFFVSILVWVLRPIIFFTRGLMKLIRGEGVPVTSLEEIRLLAELGMTEGAFAEGTGRMIQGAARLKELTAYDVMVPRTEMVFLSGRRSVRENLQMVRASGYSRLPYSREGKADRIDGIVLTRDLLFGLYVDGSTEAGESTPPPSLRAGEETSEAFFDTLARPVEYVTESSSVEELLRKFQDTRSHLAMVVDEYGGTEGIVTLEDVLEEIVGEIQDESDRVAAFINRRADGRLFCRGRAETRKIFDVLSISEEVESVTLSGLISERLGRVPVVGDTVVISGYLFEVLRANPRGVERAVITPETVPPSA